MSYARVVWYEKDRNVEYEEVVPSKWIDSNGTTLHWPVDIKSVPNAIRERFSPQKNWKKFNIKKTKCLDKDFDACQAYNYTSSENRSKKKKTKPVREELPLLDTSAATSLISPADILKGVNSRFSSDSSFSIHKEPLKSTPVLNRSKENRLENSISSPASTSFSIRSCAKNASTTDRGEKTRKQRHTGAKRHAGAKRHSDRNQYQSSITRSKSPFRSRSRSCVGTRSKSPVRSRSRSRVGTRSKSPVRSRSRSHVGSRSRSYVGSRSRSRVGSRSRSRVGSRSKSPVRSRSRSRVRSLSRHIYRRDSTFPWSVEKFQDKVINLLVTIKNNVQQVLEKDVHAIDPPTHFFNQIEVIEEFERIEQKIKDDNERRKIVSQLSKIRGITVAETVRSLWRRIMSNNLMKEFNFLGVNRRERGERTRLQKRGISQTNIYKIVSECVFNAHHDATEKMLKKATSEMLRAAPDRRGGGGRPLRTER